MKKILVLLLLILLNINVVFASKLDKDYSIRFNGSKFHLLYSVKNKDFGGYLNEYYKKGETYNIWSELVAVHHFPNAYSPIDRIKDFKDYLGSMHVPSSLTFDDKKNTAMIDFIMISDHSAPVVIEFNIFKYEKSKKCGSIAIQYARRYTATTTMQIEAIKKDIEKNRKNLIKKVKNFEIPEVISKDIDKCISAADIIEDTKVEEAKNEEKIASEQNPEDTNVAEENNTKEEDNNTEIQTTGEDLSIKNDDTTTTAEAPAEEATKAEEAKVEEKTEQVKEEMKIDVQEADKAEITTEKKEETAAEEKTDILPAPVPVEEGKINKKKTKNKKNKNDNYEITNDKNEYIAVPRTKQELKEEIKAKKQKQKYNAKQAKIQAKADKKAAKTEAKNIKKQNKIDKKTAKANLKEQKRQDKINKKEAKKAEKQAKKPYTISNSNADLIAKPRTKKELKENNKQLRQKQKNKKKDKEKAN